ncbi:MAG TPA: hypothetical protein VF230_08690 [Acidimicrobiales bacterium]
MVAVRVFAFVAGVVIAGGTALSAVRSFVVPRALPVLLSRAVFLAVRRLFLLTMSKHASYERVDRRFALYAPVALLSLVATWLTVMLFAYALMYWALGDDPWYAIEVSGSSLLTLGFDHPTSRAGTLLSFTEGALGIGLLALLITYLPTIYGAFQRREALVAVLAVRAGTPPWAITMLRRYHAIGLSERSDELWQQAEAWFADLEETHTSLSALVYFRSPQPPLHWVPAAGALLDAAALSMAAMEGPRQPNAALSVRSGFLALRRIADVLGIPYDPDPRPDDPISITREEFDAGLDELVAVGASVKADRDQAWRDFAGWRVNYDSVLLALARRTFAPPAPWTSDREPVASGTRSFRRQ